VRRWLDWETRHKRGLAPVGLLDLAVVGYLLYALIHAERF
jgi:K+-transporting ATPase KdpF subunit